MIAVCDMGPLHYLVLLRAEHLLPQMFRRVLTPSAVLAEMSHTDTPAVVRGWATTPPPWLEVKDPTQVEDIPSLGRKGSRGAGEKAAIALAREERADVILMDDKTGRREAKNRGLQPLWMLQVLDEAAERGLVRDLAQKLEYLEQGTRFYVGKGCKRIIEDMKQRDLQRTQTHEQEQALQQQRRHRL